MGSVQSKKGDQRNPVIKDQYLTPSTLYPNLNTWDLRTIRKLILSRKLAPFYPGRDKDRGPPTEETEESEEECPICFLFYPCLNRSSCCKKGICTECFLQIKKPNVLATCPFCNRPNYAITFTGALSKEEKEKDAQEQQKVIALRIKIRNEEIENDRLRGSRRNTSSSSTEIQVPGSPLGPDSQTSRSLPTSRNPYLDTSHDNVEPFSSSSSISSSISPSPSTSPPVPNAVRSSREDDDVDWSRMMQREEYELALAISLSLQSSEDGSTKKDEKPKAELQRSTETPIEAFDDEDDINPTPASSFGSRKKMFGETGPKITEVTPKASDVEYLDIEADGKEEVILPSNSQKDELNPSPRSAKESPKSARESPKSLRSRESPKPVREALKSARGEKNRNSVSSEDEELARAILLSMQENK